jgi:hypothetical protein
VPIGSIGGADAPSSGPLHVVTNDGQTSNDIPFTVIFSFDRSQWATPNCIFRVDSRFPALHLAAAVAAATQTWDSVGTPLQFVDGGNSGARAVLGDGHNDIVWSSGLPAGYSARTSTYTVGSCIVEADTKLSTTVAWGDATTDGSTTDLQTIVLHELGHWLGLRDLYGQSDAAKVMYGVRGAGETYRSLAPADRAGKLWIYQAARWDHTPPTTILRSAFARAGGFARFTLKIADSPYSCGAARVTVFVKQGAGMVPWVTFDELPTGVWQHPRFRCTLTSGTYQIAAVATDSAGNKRTALKFQRLDVL